MKKISTVVALAMVFALVAQVQAQDEKKQKKGGNRGQGQVFAIGQLNKSLAKAELTEEQQAKIKAIVAKHREGLAELTKARRAIINQEVNKKMQTARKAAAAEGKKGRELQEIVNKAAGLSEEDLKKFGEVQKKLNAASMELKKAVVAVLTDEQKEKAAIRIQSANQKKRKNNKKKTEKSDDTDK